MTDKPDIRYKKTAPTKKLVSIGSFRHYKRIHKGKKSFDAVKSYAEFSRIARAILKNVAHAMVNRSGGVFMRGLGYFCVWMSPIKSQKATVQGKNGRVISLMNFDEPYTYNPHLFVHSKGQGEMKGWSMERAFHREIRKGVHRNLHNYKPYTFHWSFVKRMFY